MLKNIYVRQALVKCILLLFVSLPFVSQGQKIGEVLDITPDHIIKDRDKLLLKFTGTRLEFDLWHDQNTRFVPLKDSAVFLSKQGIVVVYIRPLNPLNYSFESTLEFVPSPISQETEVALQSIGKSLLGFIGKMDAEADKADQKHKAAEEEAKKAKKPAPQKASATEGCKNNVTIETLIKHVNDLTPLLKKDQKKQVADIFKELKALTFERDQETKDEIDRIFLALEPLTTDVGDIEVKIALLESDLAKYECDEPHPYIVNAIFSEQISKMKIIYKEKNDRLNNLKKTFELVKKAYRQASTNEEGLRWMVPFKTEKADHTVAVKKGMTSNYLVTIYETGFKLSDNSEIVVQDKKEKIKSLIRIIRYQRFLTEVVPGVAYSFLEYPKFGTQDDGSGKHLVADAGTEKFKRINFNAMVNFNYFVPHSAVLPFVQIGVGVNADYPAFFTGGGLRFDIGSGTVKAISISGGIVSAWVQTLKTLKLGDPVSGTAELEKDITHEFKWPPKPYIAFQLRF